MNKRDIARETKRLSNNENARLQITKRKNGGYNAYLAYGNNWYIDDADENTIGFIYQPMTIKGVSEWLAERTV